MNVEREPTLQDVARLAGVHPSTASRSLDPLQSSRIRAATRERVVQAARDLNYQPHLAASSLRSRRSRTVGVIVPDLKNPIYGALVAGISARLEADGYTAIILETRNEQERMATVLRILSERRVEGAVNAAARVHDQRRLAQFVRKGIPLVLAARDVPALKVPRVLNDDFKGASLAADHLLSLGHQRVLQITGPADIASFAERTRGFHAALGSLGGAVELRELPTDATTVEEGHRAMRTALRHREPPTAVFAHNDLLAIGALAAIQEAGLRCPEDVSVVGYNNIPLTQYLNPPLTTILLPAGHLGRVAADTVLSLLRGVEPLSTVAVHPELVIRKSTGPARPARRRVG